MAARLAEDVPRRGTMREARNDEVPYYASRMHSASPRLAISALHSSANPPVCARFAHLDWGYEKFSLSEAGSTDARPSVLSAKGRNPLSGLTLSHASSLWLNTLRGSPRQEDGDKPRPTVSTGRQAGFLLASIMLFRPSL